MKSLLILVLVSILACGFASAALDISNIEVEVDDQVVNGSSSVTAGLEKDDTIEVEVSFRANADMEIEIEAVLSGDGKKDKVSDSTDEFDVHNGTSYVKKLELELPQRMDQDREYQLRVTISSRYDHVTVTGTVDIASADHSVQIRDIVLSPENEVKAGRALLATVRVKNRGTNEEEDIKVKASVPGLGISASDYIDQLDPEDCDDEDCDDSTTSEELYMRIPDCAEPGEYTVQVCVEYDDGDEEDCDTTKIDVVESDTCLLPGTEAIASTGKTIITIGPDTQDIAKGGSAMYPITVSNEGAESKVYSIIVDSADWAEFSVTPSNVIVVGAGESKAAYISLKAKSVASGPQVFAATIKSGESVLKQVPLRANIAGGVSATSIGGIKKVLEVGLVVLVVLLVVLGLIIGFNKLKGSEDEEAGEEKTYY